ncbi:MAG TPA: hypothetical protein VGX68_27450 [Thermoanaerobaculia bacterium]|jgi:hypothetical protein|nr:hypothetical protein [Thermoanaerobaculia bacterium]
MISLLHLLPGLWVLLLGILFAWTLRRWFDPVPVRCWAAWGIALAVMFGAVLFAGRVMLPLGYLTKVPPFADLVEGTPPGNLLQSDLVLQIAPWLVRVREAYGAGEWPLWNALSGAGEPLLANPQSQAFQPLVWLALPFPVASGFGVIAALRVLLALVFTWLLLRRQGISELPALAGSFAYGLGGFLQLWLGWPLAGSAVFLPVLLYGLVLTDQRGARRDSLLLALAVASVLLVGHPETILHVSMLAGAFALSRLLARPKGRRLALLRSWAISAVLGAALAAPVALPAAEYLPKSLRVVLLEARRERLRAGPEAQDEMPTRGHRQRGIVARLLPSAAPNAFGNNRFGVYWGEHNTVEDAAGFAGTAALLAALAAAWPRASGRRFPQERLMLGTALVCLVILARPPGMERLFDSIPVLRSSLSFHSRVSLLLGFATAYAAACSWERWLRGEVRLRRIVPLGAALAALIAWAYLAHPGPHPQAFAWLRYASLTLQIVVVAATLFFMTGRPSRLLGWGITLVAAVELTVLHAPAHPPVSAELYYPETPPIAFLRRRLDPWHRMAGLGSALRPNFPSVYGFADPRGSNPAKPAAYVEATRRINRFPTRATDGFVAPEDPLYGRLGVRFLMTAPETHLREPWRLVFHRRRAWIYQNRGAVPLLFLAGSNETLELGAIRPDWLRARARLGEPRMLASSVYQDGNWKLLLGGRRQRTTLADGPFVAAWLPRGETSIDLLYRPVSFAAGLVIAALALATGAALWVPPPQTALRSQTRSQRSA